MSNTVAKRSNLLVIAATRLDASDRAEMVDCLNVIAELAEETAAEKGDTPLGLALGYLAGEYRRHAAAVQSGEIEPRKP